MSIRALIFDVDGTLADTEETHRRAFNAAFERQGLRWHWSEREYGRLLSTPGGKERLRAHVESLPIWPTERRLLASRIPAIHETKTVIYGDLVGAGHAPLREGIARLIDQAQCAGIRLAIASTTTLANIEALLRASFGPSAMERFAVVAAGDVVPRKKPAPDIYRRVLEELRLPPSECVALEDSTLGLRAAKAAGLFTVVTPSRWTRHESFAGADWVAASLGSYERPLQELERRICG